MCGKRQLNLEDHYVRVKLPNTPAGVYTIPEPQEIIRKMVRFVTSRVKCTCKTLNQYTHFIMTVSLYATKSDVSLLVNSNINKSI